MTDTITAEQLAEWKALADAATKGDWKVEPPDPSKKRRKPNRFVECVLTEGNFAGLQAVIAQAGNPHDRDFIAAAHTALPALLTEIERLQAELVEERTAVLELQREACARDGVPMPSERPLVDKLRTEVDRLREALREIRDHLKDGDDNGAYLIARAALPEET